MRVFPSLPPNSMSPSITSSVKEFNQQWSRWANFVVLWVRHFFGMIKINFLLPIFGEEYSEGSQEWTFSIKKEIYCKNFSLLILPTKAFRRFLPKLCAFSPRHQWLGILVIPTHINSQSPENAINPINLATNIYRVVLLTGPP